jgi:hypothetical protein
VAAVASFPTVGTPTAAVATKIEAATSTKPAVMSDNNVSRTHASIERADQPPKQQQYWRQLQRQQQFFFSSSNIILNNIQNMLSVVLVIVTWS